ncbi:MAG: hypothetical protein IJS55_03325 [Oscillospiraceae bacterium]|nr:hypothetical protein [Oscillospiraceae bacterium]
MARFSVPGQPSRRNIVIDRFRGVDMTSSPSTIDPTRAADAPNMVRDQVGTVRKRMGYELIYDPMQDDFGTKDEPIQFVYGVHHLGLHTLVHFGRKLWWVYGGSLEYNTQPRLQLIEKETVGIGTSRSFVFEGKLYLLTPSGYYVYDGNNVTKVSEIAYVPTVIISRRPSGGGTVLEGYNLIGRRWKESFLGTAADTVYQLTQDGLDSDTVQVSVMQPDGSWAALTEGTDFTVDRQAGTVTFTTAPGASPVSGADNVEITVAKTNSDNAAIIDGCRIFALYGVGGASDRVFLGGNPDKPGVDWYSGFEDPTYFPDINYTKLSRDGASLKGYAVVRDTLVSFMVGSSDGRNVVVRSGALDSSGNAVFPITNTLQGPELFSADSICATEKEPLYVTDRGVYTITAEELTGERYSQERGYYVRSGVTVAYDACMYGDFYAVLNSGGIYLLDTRQRSFERNTPYSTFQYEAYYWPITGMHRLWAEGSALLMSDDDGKIYRFYKQPDAPSSYADCGEAIDAWWETTDLDGDIFYKNKTFCGLAIRLAAASNTGVKISALARGVWKEVFDSGDKAHFFDWSYIDFEHFTFNADRTPRTLNGKIKIKIKKADKARFRLQNDRLNESFGLYAFGVEYKMPGSNYKQ